MMIHNKKCWVLCTIITLITISVILLVFIIIFVTVPLVIKKSVDLQRKLIFPTSQLLPSDPEFDNFKKYNLRGVRNFQVTVNTEDLIFLGVWHLLPHALVNDSIEHQNFDYSATLARAEYSVIIHFHSSNVNRIKSINTYNVLRNFFHVIAFDYRGYGDSTDVTPSEESIVQDSIQLYKWLRSQTTADIYFWGHSLGASLSTHTVAKLREEHVQPTGLFLEAPFTSMRDQLQEKSFYRFFSWLPWYESTMLDPLEQNGFILNTTKYITMVDCPIMIIHAEDDTITPYTFAEKLAKVGQEERAQTHGNVTFHLLPANLHCGHFQIRKAPEILRYILNHIRICRWYKSKRGRN